MTLQVFNPEHDLALASGLSNFTAPHAGRRLRADLGYLPALWAGSDDYVLVEHVEQARRAYGRLRARVGGSPRRFVDRSQLSRLDIDRVEPWGWDMALRSSLIRYGVAPEACATEVEINAVREYSHRRYAAEVLRLLGWQQPFEATTLEAVDSHLSTFIPDVPSPSRCLSSFHPSIVVKAPWSSSGRGVRFIDGALSDYHRGWIRNIIRQQGSVMVEPYYQKVKDFGMEFEALADGTIRYHGLSLFETRNGAYMGNIVASEEEKLKLISNYVPIDSIDTIRANVKDALRQVFGGHYTGLLGVDMMILSNPDRQGFSVHPCVEINLRRTMGHVAISMAEASPADLPRVMQIDLTDKYRIHIRRL